MNLHRADKIPDWEKIPKEEWTRHHVWAARTGGIATRANGYTLAGLGFMLAGANDILNDRPVSGLIKMAAGKACDWWDGRDADKTGTKSPLGKKLDASTDKIVVAATVPRLMDVGAMPKWAGGLILAQNVACAAATTVGTVRGMDMNTAASNKWTNGLQAAEAGAFTAAWIAREHYDRPVAARRLDALGKAQAAVTTALGAVAAVNLWRQALRPAHGVEAAAEQAEPGSIPEAA